MKKLKITLSNGYITNDFIGLIDKKGQFKGSVTTPEDVIQYIDVHECIFLVETEFYGRLNIPENGENQNIYFSVSQIVSMINSF